MASLVFTVILLSEALPLFPTCVKYTMGCDCTVGTTSRVAENFYKTLFCLAKEAETLRWLAMPIREPWIQ